MPNDAGSSGETNGRKVRIAILVADEVSPSIKTLYSDMFTWFTDLFNTAAHHYFPGLEVETVKFDTYGTLELPSDPKEFDALLVTGSKSGVYDMPTSEWMKKLDNYIREAYTAGAKQIGVCFGHQLVAHSLGGKVELSPKGWEIGKVDIELDQDALKALGTKRKIIPLLASHKDHVLEAPPGFTVLGSTPLCAVHGIYKPGLVFTTQAHPEVNPAILEEIVKARHEQGVFSDAQKDDILAKIHAPKLDYWYGAKLLAFALGEELSVVPDPHEPADYDL